MIERSPVRLASRRQLLARGSAVELGVFDARGMAGSCSCPILSNIRARNDTDKDKLLQSNLLSLIGEILRVRVRPCPITISLTLETGVRFP